MKKLKTNASVGNTGHFDNEIELPLGRHESRQHQASEDRLVFPVGHGVIVLLRAHRDRALWLNE